MDKIQLKYKEKLNPSDRYFLKALPYFSDPKNNVNYYVMAAEISMHEILRKNS